MLRLMLLIPLVILGGCSSQIWDEAEHGKLSGAVIVFWVAEGDPDVGDGKFIYIAPKGDPLRFDRPGTGGTIDKIQPGMIYTDGGSIPRFVQPLRGLNPWGYAPAYMVHDWLFFARKCLNDNEAKGEELKIVDVEFRESAVIMAELLRTLIKEKTVSDDDVAPAAITWAVNSSVSQALWNERGECERNRVSAEHIAQIEKALPGATGEDTRGLTVSPRDVEPARLIAQVSF